jgi:hypothetical protein
MRRVRHGFSLLALSAVTLVAAAGMVARAQQPPSSNPQGQQPPANPSAQPAEPGQPPPGMPPGMPPGGGPPHDNWKPEKLTNLNVLPKDTTPDQIMATMRTYTQSLGVGCLGCHKGQQGKPMSTFDFADDSKENKEIARAMIKLTQDINTKYPDAFPKEDADKDKPKVTCATCHRRNRHPETEPPPPPPRPGEPTQGAPGAPQATPQPPRPPA